MVTGRWVGCARSSHRRVQWGMVCPTGVEQDAQGRTGLCQLEQEGCSGVRGDQDVSFGDGAGGGMSGEPLCMEPPPMGHPACHPQRPCLR